MPQPVARPAERYGAPRPTSRPVGAGVVALVAAFVGWVVWAGLGAAAPDVRGDVTAFRVRSSAALDVRVTAAAGTTGTLTCTVRALDRTRDVVGVGEVTLISDRAGQRQRWVTIRTRDRAVTATVGRCAAVGGD